MIAVLKSVYFRYYLLHFNTGEGIQKYRYQTFDAIINKLFAKSSNCVSDEYMHYFLTFEHYEFKRISMVWIQEFEYDNEPDEKFDNLIDYIWHREGSRPIYAREPLVTVDADTYTGKTLYSHWSMWIRGSFIGLKAWPLLKKTIMPEIICMNPVHTYSTQHLEFFFYLPWIDGWPCSVQHFSLMISRLGCTNNQGLTVRSLSSIALAPQVRYSNGASSDGNNFFDLLQGIEPESKTSTHCSDLESIKFMDYIHWEVLSNHATRDETCSRAIDTWWWAFRPVTIDENKRIFTVSLLRT